MNKIETKVIEILKGFISKKLIVCVLVELLGTWLLLNGKIQDWHWLCLTGGLAFVYLFVQGNIDVAKLNITIGGNSINDSGKNDTTGGTPA